MENFEKTKKLIEQYKDFDKKIEEKDSEMKRIDLSIERIDEESENIILEEYEDSGNIQQNETYKMKIKAEYDKRKKDLNKEKEFLRKEKADIEKDKKYFRTDANLKTITMEVMDIDKEIKAQELKLKEVELETQKFFSQEQHEEPLKWMELYKEKDSINKTIEELKNKKVEYEKFLQELKDIELTPEEYKEMFAREAEAEKAEVEKAEAENAELGNTETEKVKSGETEQVKPTKQGQANNPGVVANVSNRENSQNLEDKNKIIPEVIIGRKVLIKNGQNEINYKLRKLLDYDKNGLVEDIKETFKDNPELLPKDIEKELKAVDPVLVQGILEALDNKVMDDKQARKAIIGVINKDKNALKDVIKIKYDKEDLSKWAFLPWNKSCRDMMAKFADENKEIAEVVGEYEPNPFKRLMKKIQTKQLESGKKEPEVQTTESKKDEKEEPKSWELTDKQKEEANSRGDLSSSNESKNEADKIKDEEGR